MLELSAWPERPLREARQKRINTPAAQERCIMRLVLYHVCVNLPIIIVSYPAFRYMGLKSNLPLPHWTVVLSQIVFYCIIEDFVFYWGHRILHTKWLYMHIHSVHHEYATPFGLTFEYAHPAEILFLGLSPYLVLPSQALILSLCGYGCHWESWKL